MVNLTQMKLFTTTRELNITFRDFLTCPRVSIESVVVWQLNNFRFGCTHTHINGTSRLLQFAGRVDLSMRSPPFTTSGFGLHSSSSIGEVLLLWLSWHLLRVTQDHPWHQIWPYSPSLQLGIFNVLQVPPFLTPCSWLTSNKYINTTLTGYLPNGQRI